MPGRADKAGHTSIALGEYDTASEAEDGCEDDDIEDLERQRGGSPLEGKDGNSAAVGEDKAKDGASSEATEAKPKRVLGPRAKLDPNRLCGASGLPALLKDFEGVEWHPKGCEKENLQMMMRKMEEWAHSMYPKTRFDDTLEKIQHLGGKRQVKTCVQKLLLGMPVLAEDFVGDNLEAVNEAGRAAEEKEFDNLFEDDMPAGPAVNPVAFAAPGNLFPVAQAAPQPQQPEPNNSGMNMEEDIPEEYLTNEPSVAVDKASDDLMEMIDLDDMDAFLRQD